MPLALLELYLWAQNKAGTRGRYSVSILLLHVTLIMEVGNLALLPPCSCLTFKQ